MERINDYHTKTGLRKIPDEVRVPEDQFMSPLIS